VISVEVRAARSAAGRWGKKGETTELPGWCGAFRYLFKGRHESEVVDFEGLNCKMWATYHIRIGVLLVNIEIDYHFVRKQLINKLPDTKFISSKD
jgi:hypothetical protein